MFDIVACKKLISIRLCESDLEELDFKCEELGVGRSDFVRMVVRRVGVRLLVDDGGDGGEDGEDGVSRTSSGWGGSVV